jgi:hypothetical protein
MESKSMKLILRILLGFIISVAGIKIIDHFYPNIPQNPELAYCVLGIFIGVI